MKTNENARDDNCLGSPDESKTNTDFADSCHVKATQARLCSLRLEMF